MLAPDCAVRSFLVHSLTVFQEQYNCVGSLASEAGGAALDIVPLCTMRDWPGMTASTESFPASPRA